MADCATLRADSAPPRAETRSRGNVALDRTTGTIASMPELFVRCGLVNLERNDLAIYQRET